MATYKQIQSHVREVYGFVAKTSWIAHVMELCGLAVRPAHNRISALYRAHPCPPHRRAQIAEALGHFGVVTT